MKNSRGMVLELYLVILTLVMCGLVLGFYIYHQNALSGSLVSPLAVLKVQDDLEIFEMRERELIISSAEGVVWNAGGTGEEFRNKFLSGMDSEMEDFIFEDLFWREQKMDGSFDRNAFLGVLYSVREESGDLILERSRIGKRDVLIAENTDDVNFPVDFQFDFEREYLISRKDGKIEVEVVG